MGWCRLDESTHSVHQLVLHYGLVGSIARCGRRMVGRLFSGAGGEEEGRCGVEVGGRRGAGEHAACTQLAGWQCCKQFY